MRKSRSLPIFFIVISMIAHANISNSHFNITSIKCSNNIKQFCFHEHTIYSSLLKKEFTDNSKNYLYLDTTNMDYISPILLTFLKNKEMLKINSQVVHMNHLLERKRSLYQLYKVNIFGQLTSPVNNEINYYKSQPPRMEGLGIRLRF
ncbi:hypothetical protein [uncultured Aquimarina sp.]|uniref:hypothetical protein n=1 Tax=uncultured Aquimarina sp. TaxID=575652 RepID=UPI0026130AA0|nr:hypothetical protein [uncultured Aquimarina sp.]